MLLLCVIVCIKPQGVAGESSDSQGILKQGIIDVRKLQLVLVFLSGVHYSM